jgi:hypothetical protein
MSTTPAPRGATAATVGGALWALVPVAFGLVDPTDVRRGTLSFVAVLAAVWICGALSLALLLGALAGLRPVLAQTRLGAVGAAVSAAGLAAMLLGNGTELTTIMVNGQESDLGHTVFLIGFLVLIAGSVLLGIALIRGRVCAVSGWIMTLALPIGIGIGLLGALLFPHNDGAFWAAIAVPTGVAWVVLGRTQRIRAAAPVPVG